MRVQWIERADGCLCASGYPVRISRKATSHLWFLHVEGFAEPSRHHSLRDAKDRGEHMAAQFDRTILWRAPALTGALVRDGVR